jgi:predicted Zn-dependent protease
VSIRHAIGAGQEIGGEESDAGQPEHAIQSYLNAIRSDPKDTMDYRLLAALAIEVAARAVIQAEPNHPELLATWGDVLRRAGRDDEATAAYTRALARDPDLPRARIGLACMAAIRGDGAGMQAQFRECQKKMPWAPQVQQFARLLERAGGLGPDDCRRYIYIR